MYQVFKVLRRQIRRPDRIGPELNDILDFIERGIVGHGEGLPSGRKRLAYCFCRQPAGGREQLDG